MTLNEILGSFRIGDSSLTGATNFQKGREGPAGTDLVVMPTDSGVSIAATDWSLLFVTQLCA